MTMIYKEPHLDAGAESEIIREFTKAGSSPFNLDHIVKRVCSRRKVFPDYYWDVGWASMEEMMFLGLAALKKHLCKLETKEKSDA
jgi:hypothetical protein